MAKLADGSFYRVVSMVNGVSGSSITRVPHFRRLKNASVNGLAG